MYKWLVILLAAWIGKGMAQDQFVSVNQGKMYRNGQPYHFMGTNFWYGMHLGAEAPVGNRERLYRELDRLQALGIQNLRIMASSEGPDDQPWRMLPSLQNEVGIFDSTLLEGLDVLLSEMQKRDMTAVVCLGNFWPWSGGMAQYVQWQQGDEIPYPPPAKDGSWVKYQLYTAQFYKDQEALKAYWAHVQKIVSRINTITGKAYKDDPTIMSWQLANEPRGILNKRAYRSWIRKTAKLIKGIDPHHLVSIGSEGATPSRWAGTRFKRDHAIKGIDYTTLHIWVQNWGWYDPEKPQESYPKAFKKAIEYLEWHEKRAVQLKMPLILEEFGISRDGNDHSDSSRVSIRDQYYKDIFGYVYQQAKAGGPLTGVNFWAWGGEGRPSSPHSVWQLEDDFIGDPPHEYQGWYSVYDQDLSTHQVIRTYAEHLKSIR